MTRWEPNARGRLELAALELYGERGYDQTTVAEIAKRAGLTERTFFRHFADKREVLFYGARMLQDWLVKGIEDAPAGDSRRSTRSARHSERLPYRLRSVASWPGSARPSSPRHQNSRNAS